MPKSQPTATAYISDVYFPFTIPLGVSTNKRNSQLPVTMTESKWACTVNSDVVSNATELDEPDSNLITCPTATLQLKMWHENVIFFLLKSDLLPG